MPRGDFDYLATLAQGEALRGSRTCGAASWLTSRTYGSSILLDFASGPCSRMRMTVPYASKTSHRKLPAFSNARALATRSRSTPRAHSPSYVLVFVTQTYDADAGV